MKDFSRSHAITYTSKVAISCIRWKTVTLLQLQQATDRKWHMAYQTVSIPMILRDFRGNVYLLHAF